MTGGANTAEGWESAFVAMSAAVGEPLEASCRALGEAGALRAGSIVRALQARDRGARARALADVLARVARDVDGMGFTWR